MDRYNQRSRSEAQHSTTTTSGRPASSTANNSSTRGNHLRTRSRDREGAASSGGNGSNENDLEELSVRGSSATPRSQQPSRPKTAHRQRTPPHNHPATPSPPPGTWPKTSPWCTLRPSPPGGAVVLSSIRKPPPRPMGPLPVSPVRDRKRICGTHDAVFSSMRILNLDVLFT